MFRFTQPGLRHHAVVERVMTVRFGSIWRVHDRRDPSIPKLLVLPTKAKPWPVLLEVLSQHQPTPTRLRNGKVAFILPNIPLIELKSSFRKSRTSSRSRLDALTGFSATQVETRSKVIAFATIIIIGGLLFIQFPWSYAQSKPLSKVPIAQKSKASTCKADVVLGMRISKGIKRFEKFKIAENTFVVANLSRFGGLTQLTLKRVCDDKYFRFDAWKSSEYLEITKLY
jgi:hypothetical protein